MQSKSSSNETSTTTTSTTVVTTASPTAEEIANIKAAITSKNTAAIEGYMADTVSFMVSPGDCGVGETIPDPSTCFERTKAQAMEELTAVVTNGYAVEWSFNVSAGTITALKNSSEFLIPYLDEDNAIVVDGGGMQYLIFNFDNNGKIDTIIHVFFTIGD